MADTGVLPLGTIEPNCPLCHRPITVRLSLAQTPLIEIDRVGLRFRVTAPPADHFCDDGSS